MTVNYVIFMFTDKCFLEKAVNKAKDLGTLDFIYAVPSL